MLKRKNIHLLATLFKTKGDKGKKGALVYAKENWAEKS